MIPEEEYQNAQALWDEFLQKWPLEKLESMTLPEYTKSGDRDTFMYWLEQRLRALGNIQGGSAFKFGIYSRSPKAKEGKNGRGYTYESDYAFYSELGTTHQEAFDTVKRAVVNVAYAARKGDLEVIEKESDLKPTVKWKIAFLYQDRSHPICPAIYRDEFLKEVSGVSANATHLEALKKLMSRYDYNGIEDIFAFSRRSWEEHRSLLYPEYDPEISKETWYELLQNSQVGTVETLTLLAQMNEEGGSATCLQLSKKFGQPVKYYIDAAAQLGEKVADVQSIEPVEDDGDKLYWVIPFTGRKLDSVSGDDRSEICWTFRPPLAQALEELELSAEYLKRTSDFQQETVETNKLPNDEIDEIVALLQFKKNLILQGAPGTGKTYRIPEIVTRLCGCTKAGDSRQMIMREYGKLKAEGRVDFTTFHPSLDYENFVQGWQPVDPDESDTDDGKQNEFEISDGIFKRISDRALLGVVKNDRQLLPFEEEPRVWKVSLAGTYENPIRKDCLQRNRIRIDWAASEDDLQAIIEDRQRGYKTLNAFCHRMKRGDFVVSCYSQTQTDAIGIIESDFYWLPEEKDFRLARNVRWIWKGEPTEVTTDFMDGYVFTLSTVYSITRRFTPSRIRDFLEKKGVLGEKRDFPPFVLAIDEINRGNISKIFGELITLLEADKRKGGSNEETCQLPFSKSPFVVPQNLYIIGTMNTADRSIGTIDYALRRRFVFYSLKQKPIKDGQFDYELFRAVSSLFVDDPDADQPTPNRETLSEEFDPLDVWPGPSYFLVGKQSRLLRYRYEIRPLLMEYLRDGVLKPLARDRILELEEKLKL